MQLRKIHIGLVPILALILMPILSLYSIVSWLSIGNVVVLVIFFARLVFHSKGKLKVRSFSIFLFWVILAAYNFLVSILNQGNAVAMSNSVVILLFGIEIALIDNSGISIEMIYPVAKCITSIVVFFLVLQVVTYYTTGTNAFSGKILPFELMESGFFQMEMRGRPSSFLPEPAHLAIFISPVYLYALTKKEWRMIIVCLVGLILSTSSTGLVIAAIVPIIYFLLESEMKLSKKILFAAATLGIVLILYLLVSSNYYDNYSNKLTGESFQNSIRIFGQLENMKHMSFTQWITGIGLNNWRDYLATLGIQSSNYSNSLFFSIISFGIVGTIVLIVGVIKASNIRFPIKDNRISFMFLFLLLIVIFSDQILFNRNLLYLLVWLFSSRLLESDEDSTGGEYYE